MYRTNVARTGACEFRVVITAYLYMTNIPGFANIIV